MTAIFAYPGYPNIRVLDDWKPYRREVVRYLDLIATTFAGRTLFNFISRKSPRFVLIVPNKSPPINSITDPQNEPDAFTRGAAVTRIQMLPDGTPALNPDGSVTLVPTGATGTGRGTNALLRYHPAMYRQLMANLQTILPGAGPGEALYHELVHAMRMLHGMFLADAGPEHLFMDDFVEFCAIVAANMYRSERGFKNLRLDHHGYSPMNPLMANSAEFFRIHESPLKRWFGSQRDFCSELARSPAPFNPLWLAADDLGIAIPPSMTLIK